MDTSDKKFAFPKCGNSRFIYLQENKNFKKFSSRAPFAGKMIEAGLEKLVEKFVREFTKDVCSLVSQNERIVFKPCSM